jgi:hypothetical protein
MKDKLEAFKDRVTSFLTPLDLGGEYYEIDGEYYNRSDVGDIRDQMMEELEEQIEVIRSSGSLEELEEELSELENLAL